MASLSELAGLNSADVTALAQAAEELLSQRKFEQAARAFGGLEALEGRRYFGLKRAQAEAQGGELQAALDTLKRLINADVAPDQVTVEALKLRANLRRPSDATAADDDLELAKKLEPTSMRWS